MASSGTYTYAPSLDDLLIEAWERCGKSESALNGEVARSAKRSLQLMLLDWTARGLNLWQVQQQLLTCVPIINSIALSPQTIDVLDATLTVSGIERPLSPIPRSDFVNIPLKASPGPPTQYWVDRLNPSPTMRLYPTPDQAYTLTAWTVMQPQDVSSLLQTADAPVLWAEAIASGLAARLAEKFAPERLEVLGPRAVEGYQHAIGENRERVPLTILTDGWGCL